jgi:prolyl-tRNA synthetase
MAHSDNAGLVLPPKVAPIQVVIVPIFKGEEQLQAISEKVNPLIKELRGRGVAVKFDDRENQRPGWKFAEYELQGVPIRLAIGARDLANGTIEIARRDEKTKETVQIEGLTQTVVDLLDEIQNNIYQKALNFRTENMHEANSWDEFKDIIENKIGFVSAHWDGTGETEQRIKEETKATIRCIPFDSVEEEGVCVYSGKPSKRKVIFAKAY